MKYFIFIVFTFMTINSCYSSEKYCINQLLGIWRWDYNDHYPSEIFKYGIDQECGCECYELYNGTDVCLSIDEIIYDSIYSPCTSLSMKYLAENNILLEISIRKYAVGFCSDSISEATADSSIMKQCGDKIVYKLLCGDELYEPCSSFDLYSDEMIFGATHLVKVDADALKYRYIKALVEISIRDKTDYLKTYIQKNICQPKSTIQTYDTMKKKKDISFNNDDVLSIIEDEDKFYKVEYYKSEELLDTCLVNKRDVVLLKDLILNK